MCTSKLPKPPSWQFYNRPHVFRSPHPFQYRQCQQEKAKHTLKPRPSLSEELFPDRGFTHDPERGRHNQDVPRLALPIVDELLDERQENFDQGRERSKCAINTEATNVFRKQQLAVLVLHIASYSLAESDFRRVTPKGKHIVDWAGPGRFLKGMLVEDYLHFLLY